MLAVAAIFAVDFHHQWKAANPIVMMETLAMKRSRSLGIEDKTILLENQPPRGMLDGHPVASLVETMHELPGEAMHGRLP